MKSIPYYIFIVIISLANTQAQTIHYGDSVAIGDGIAKTWIEIDSDNNPIRIGLTLTEGALSNLPGVLRMMSLDFPMVTNDSLFKHMLFDWEPNGHPPGSVYGLPHFDFHFYNISKAVRNSISGGIDDSFIPPIFIPEDYNVFPVLGYTAIANMGVHFADFVAPEFNGSIFTKTLVYGFSQGKMVFIEPMITKRYLETHPNDDLLIKQPKAYQKSGYYPTKYQIKYDSDKQAFDVMITDFVLRSAGVTDIKGKENEIPENFFLSQNFPNPFNPRTKIKSSAEKAGYVKLAIYNLIGEEINVLVNGYQEAGFFEVDFDASNLPSGTYIYRLQAPGFVEAKKMLLMK